MLVGYARVSTTDQDTALQMDALKKGGVKRVYTESGSGVGPRPELQRALASLCTGDTLVVWKLDRIARGLGDLLRILDGIKTRGASIKSLTEPIDTSSPIGEFTFQILGAVAQLERSMIRERVMAGQMAARARGKRWGPPHLLTPEQQTEVVFLYLGGDVTQKELAERYGVQRGVIRAALDRVLRPDAPYINPPPRGLDGRKRGR